MRKLKGDFTKEKILKAAMALIAKHGFWKVSFQDIANKCRIHQPAIFYYFPTKEALYREIVTEVIRGSHDYIAIVTAKAQSPQQALELHFEGNLSWAEANSEHASILLLLYYNAAVDAKYAALYQPILEGARARIAVLLAPFKLGAQADLVSRLMHDSLLGGIVNYLSSGRQPSELSLLRKRWALLHKQFI